jgi:hypothetical protein
MLDRRCFVKNSSVAVATASEVVLHGSQARGEKGPVFPAKAELRPEAVAGPGKDVEAKQPHVAAADFLSALLPDQLPIANLSYEDGRRSQWNFVPMTDRKGLPLKDMTADQQNLAMLLLKSVVSDFGYERSKVIMDLEAVLREQEGPQSAARRDPTKYHFIVYGTPAKAGLRTSSFVELRLRKWKASRLNATVLRCQSSDLPR